MAESFFVAIQRELIDEQSWQDHTTLRQSVFEYIEVFYNRERLHSSLDYQTPAQKERNYHNTKPSTSVN